MKDRRGGTASTAARTAAAAVDALRRLRRGVRWARREGVRAGRRLRAKLGTSRLRLVYHEGYRLPPNEIADPRRAERIITYLDHEGWLDARSVIAPRRLGMVPLLRVHTRDYLESMDELATLVRVSGAVATTPEAGRQLLEAQRWATAGTVLATALALRAPQRGPVVNLGGGFHHAHRDRGGGFCLLNDVAIAVEEARAKGFSGRVLVIDLDLHHGDGTRSVFADDDRVFTFSIHADAWDTSPAAASLDVALGPAVGDTTFLRALGDSLPEAFARARPDLVIYVAGVDVAAGDRLGGWRLGADAIAQRDERVLALCRGLPTVMVMAGGYGPEAWRYTARTLAKLSGGDGGPIPSEAETSLAHFRRLRARLDPSALVESSTGDPFTITEADVYGELFGKQVEARLLGFYSLYRLELAIEHYGLADHLRARGYPSFDASLHGNAPTGPTVIIHADASHREVLLELCMKEMVVAAPTPGGADEAPLRLASIEWMLLQDPRAVPSPDRPLLPGQKHPGLGCLRLLVGMLVMACERLGLDGLTFVPSQYHVAAQGRSLATFLDPADEGFWVYLEELARGRSVAEITLAIASGLLEDPRTGAPIRWRPARMVIPVSERLRTIMGSTAYARAVEGAARAQDRAPDRSNEVHPAPGDPIPTSPATLEA